MKYGNWSQLFPICSYVLIVWSKSKIDQNSIFRSDQSSQSMPIFGHFIPTTQCVPPNNKQWLPLRSRTNSRQILRKKNSNTPTKLCTAKWSGWSSGGKKIRGKRKIQISGILYIDQSSKCDLFWSIAIWKFEFRVDNEGGGFFLSRWKLEKFFRKFVEFRESHLDMRKIPMTVINLENYFFREFNQPKKSEKVKFHRIFFYRLMAKLNFQPNAQCREWSAHQDGEVLSVKVSGLEIHCLKTFENRTNLKYSNNIQIWIVRIPYLIWKCSNTAPIWNIRIPYPYLNYSNTVPIR